VDNEGKGKEKGEALGKGRPPMSLWTIRIESHCGNERFEPEVVRQKVKTGKARAESNTTGQEEAETNGWPQQGRAGWGKVKRKGGY